MHEDRSDRVVAHCCDVLPLSALVIMAVFRCFAKKNLRWNLANLKY